MSRKAVITLASTFLVILSVAGATGWIVPLPFTEYEVDGKVVTTGGRRLVLLFGDFYWQIHGRYEVRNNGILHEMGTYANNKRIGTWLRFDEQGLKEAEDEYGFPGGTMLKETVFDPDGRVNHIDEFVARPLEQAPNPLELHH